MMRQKRRTCRKKNSPALIAIFLLLVIGAGMFSIYSWERKQQKEDAAIVDALPIEMDEVPERELIIDGKKHTIREGIETFLILGLDKYEEDISDPDSYNNNQQSDFILLMVIDSRNGDCFGIQINRDTMTDIPRLGVGGIRIGTKFAQLALAYTYGSGGRDSCNNTAEAVSRLLCGVPIDHYVSLTMDAVSIINDLVGGVKVWIEDDFSNTDSSMIQGTWMTLSGKQALTFIRSRMSMQDSSNLARMKRQRVYLNALYEQVLSRLEDDDRFAWKLASELSDYTISDFTASELSSFVDRLKGYSYQSIDPIIGEARKGDLYIEFYPDEDAMGKLLLEKLC